MSFAKCQIADDVLSAFRDIKLKKLYRYVLFVMAEDGTIAVGKKGDRDSTHEDFVNAVPSFDCRYAIYDYEYCSTDGRKTSKLFFINWSPLNATPRAKIRYTQAMLSFREHCTGTVHADAQTEEDLVDLLEDEDVADDDNDSDF
ncbi:MAG: hypothetical protein MHM6MM_002097 [Cercozoa sp. M6MM]